MFRSARLGPAAGAVVAMAALAAACRCTGGGGVPEAGLDAGEAAAGGCDAAWCTSACLASGAECGRCVEDVGCRCNADCMEPENHCPPEAIEWNYPPISERALGESWDFDPPTWDVSAARFQPQEGCELISLTGTEDPPPWPGWPPTASTWVTDRYVALQDLVTRCVDGWPARAEAVFLLDTTAWRMALIYVQHPSSELGPARMAVLEEGMVFTVSWQHASGEDSESREFETLERAVVYYSAGRQRQKVVKRYDGSRGTLSLHSSGGLVLQQFGTEDSSFFLFDTETEAWSPLATFGGRGIGGVWRVVFSGERAVWDVGSGGGIMTAVASRPEETSGIGYTGAAQWGPALSDELVCWNERPAGEVCGCLCGPTACPGKEIRCADLRTNETFGLSGEIPPDSCLCQDTPINSYVSASGPWILFHVQPCDLPSPRPSRALLYHRRLGRSFPFVFAGRPRGALLLTGDHIVTGYFPRSGEEPQMPTGYYRCDLRVLFPEAYAAPPPPDAPADGGED